MQYINRYYCNYYKVSYQAIGSTVIQYGPLLQPGDTMYAISQLHENTYYSICVRVFAKLAAVRQTRHCINVSTSIDSFSFAIGSTFGAFLALGIIVFFVFVAKWQHNRKLQKQLQSVQPYGDDAYKPVTQSEVTLEMSDLCLHLSDDTARMDLSSLSSLDSNFTAPDVVVANGHSPSRNGREDPVTVHVHIPLTLAEIAAATPFPRTTSALPSVHNGRFSSPDVMDIVIHQDGRPPDVRPKDPAMFDFNSAYAPHKPTSMAASPMHHPVLLRVNWSCNW